MARETIVQVTDDLDGSKAAKEVSFAFEGVQYTIDLSAKNRAALEKALKPYIAAGTKVPARSGRRPNRSGGSPRRDLASVRSWARENGYPVSDRGRVPSAVVDAYDASH